MLRGSPRGVRPKEEIHAREPQSYYLLRRQRNGYSPYRPGGENVRRVDFFHPATGNHRGGAPHRRLPTRSTSAISGIATSRPKHSSISPFFRLTLQTSKAGEVSGRQFRRKEMVEAS